MPAPRGTITGVNTRVYVRFGSEADTTFATANTPVFSDFVGGAGDDKIINTDDLTDNRLGKARTYPNLSLQENAQTIETDNGESESIVGAPNREPANFTWIHDYSDSVREAARSATIGSTIEVAIYMVKDANQGVTYFKGTLASRGIDLSNLGDPHTGSMSIALDGDPIVVFN